MNFISWASDRQKYKAFKVHVEEVDKGNNYSTQYKIEALVQGKRFYSKWLKPKWQQLDNPYNSSDTSLIWDEEDVRRYARHWKEYFENPDKYDIDVPNIIYSEEIITVETHPENFV